MCSLLLGTTLAFAAPTCLLSCLGSLFPENLNLELRSCHRQPRGGPFPVACSTYFQFAVENLNVEKNNQNILTEIFAVLGTLLKNNDFLILVLSFCYLRFFSSFVNSTS